MAALIGNAVMLIVFIIIFQKLTGANTNVNSKIRKTIKNLDDSLSQTQQKMNRNSNPQDYCNSAELYTQKH